MKHISRPFRQLRGKLTLTYTLTSVVAFLLVELLLIGGAILIAFINIQGIVLYSIRQEAPQALRYFPGGRPDRVSLSVWLQVAETSIAGQEPFHFHPVFLTVVDTQGRVIASIGTQPFSPDSQLQTQLPAHEAASLTHVLRDNKGTTSTVEQEGNDSIVAIAPIVGQHTLGALIIKVDRPQKLQLLLGFFQFFLFTGIVITIIAVIVGVVFGMLAGRGIIHRLKRLAAITARWGAGDFSVMAQDNSDDELGQLSRQLNAMAEQLQHLLATRQKLATLEERNRLARDLHDSVKQQIFAISMQIGATRVLLKRDAEAADARLGEAQKLVQQAQQELTSLIRELRPVALEGKGLTAALRELITGWTQQTGIVANLRIEGAQTLPLTVEEALYRVAQEGLSNIARHSQATLVQVVLTLNDETVALSVVDNGQGFDTTRNGHAGVGLTSMQERMKALGGNVQVESTPGKGTRISATCPVLGIPARDPSIEAIESTEQV